MERNYEQEFLEGQFYSVLDVLLSWVLKNIICHLEIHKNGKYNLC